MTVAPGQRRKPPITAERPWNSKPFISNWVLPPIIRGEIYRPTGHPRQLARNFRARRRRSTCKGGECVQDRATSDRGEERVVRPAVGGATIKCRSQPPVQGFCGVQAVNQHNNRGNGERGQGVSQAKNRLQTRGVHEPTMDEILSTKLISPARDGQRCEGSQGRSLIRQDKTDRNCVGRWRGALTFQSRRTNEIRPKTSGVAFKPPQYRRAPRGTPDAHRQVSRNERINLHEGGSATGAQHLRWSKTAMVPVRPSDPAGVTHDRKSEHNSWARPKATKRHTWLAP